ncbi:hypothetical protein PQX77_010722 [Marasmius sp. AFHP31]|nr:hypothetical protein PQX77_010722 [Marasmius sp. AFHP31]
MASGISSTSVPPTLSTSLYCSSTNPASSWQAPNVPPASQAPSLSPFSLQLPSSFASSSSSLTQGATSSAFGVGQPSSSQMGVTPYVSTTRPLVSNPRGSAFSATRPTMAETAQGIKSKGKGLSKTHEHAVDPPILTRGGFLQPIAVVRFSFSSGVTTFHPHGMYTSKTRRDARISKAYMGRQLEYADSTGHLVELDVHVKDTAKDNLYPSIYTIVAANCNSQGFLFGDAPLPVKPPSSPPFLPLKIICMSCGDALLGPSGLENKWSLNELNRQTADHSIGLNHKKRLVVICVPTCIMTGSVAGLRDGLEEGIHGCY